MDTKSASQKHALIKSVKEDRQRRIRKAIARGKRRKRIRAALKDIIPGACMGILAGSCMLYAIATEPAEPAEKCEPYRFKAYNGQCYTPEEYEQFKTEKAKYEQEGNDTGSSRIVSLGNGSQNAYLAEAYLLEKIAMAEAEGEDTEGKALVMLVVLNRVWSDKFPNTVNDVIFQDGAFTSVSDGRYDRVEPNDDCYAAVELITTGQWDGSHGAIYFERTSDQETWHSQNLQKLFTHGNHTFYKEYE